MKKLLSALLSSVLILSFFPLSAGAAPYGTVYKSGSWRITVSEDGATTISGNDLFTESLNKYIKDSTSVIIEEGVTGIDDKAFKQCFNLSEINYAGQSYENRKICV